MAKNRFEALDDNEEIITEAKLKDKEETKSTFQMSVYGMNRELADKIKDTGESTSGFAKRAIRKLAKEEGII
ncbi:MAG: hypothetical protein DRG78_02665 [Epsilonproteobacteria bacterium]|nr:MAG: hypothetical protein DRG78_02665 [Campylobacterota bacterium]